MNRRFLWGALLALIGGTIAIIFLRWHFKSADELDVTEKDIREARLKLQGRSLVEKPQPTPVLNMDRKVRLAIGGLGFAEDDRNNTAMELMTPALTGATGLELVERQSLNKVLSELQLSLSGLVRAKDAVAVGKLLRADWFLLGSAVSLGATNSLVLRLVDARTGVLRDAGVVSADQSATKLTSEIAQFVRLSRQTAAQARPRTYLAIGAFEDFSVNNRRADFPAQLRSYLMAAYRNGNVTMLEREYVEALLSEVRLDLAGLTDQSGGLPPQPMQSAFWLVSGQYQSYETTNLQVEVALDIHRMFGSNKHLKIRGQSVEQLGTSIKAAVDEAINSSTEILAPTRAREERLQLAAGKDIQDTIIHGREFGLIYSHFGPTLDHASERNDVSITRRARNVQEAIRAFQTVLLLNTTNREAKVRLAACLRDMLINRPDEARMLYREVIEDGVQDHWSEVARNALVASFYQAPDAALIWFKKAASQTGNSGAAEFYHQQAAAAESLASSDNRIEDKSLAEQNLFLGIQEFKTNYVLELPSGGFPMGPSHEYCMGMHDYVKAFGNDRAQAAAKLVELLPKMKSQAPDLEPYLVASAASFQVDRQAPVVAEFERSLSFCIEHPDQVLKPTKYWQYIRWQVCMWCYVMTNYDLAVKLLEGERHAASAGYIDFNDGEKVKLAYAYLETKQYKESLEMFESFSNQPVEAPPQNGPWGPAWTMIRTDKAAAYCREKLGLEVAKDPRRFEMGPNCVCMHTPSAFVADNEGLWLAIAGQLMRLDLNLKTNLTLSLPAGPDRAINCVAVGRDKIWIGTDGSGLIECDRTTHKSRQLTVTDGLLMDSVSAVHETGDLLWIGYSGTSGGGVGQLDLRSGKLRSFMPSWIDYRGQSTPSAARDYCDMATLPNGAIPYPSAANQTWRVEGVEFLQFELEIETPSPTNSSDITVTNKFVLSQDESEIMMADIRTNAHGRKLRGMKTTTAKPGLVVRHVQDNQKQTLVDLTAVPNRPTALTLRDDELWVGGQGYLARIDLKQNQVRNFAWINAESVARIRVAGGFVWAQYANHLHRARLP